MAGAGFAGAAGFSAAAAGLLACAASPALVVVTVASLAPSPAATVVAFGFAAAGSGFGFAAAGFGFAAAGFGLAAAAFGFAVVFGAVPDFGAPAAPAFGAPVAAVRLRGLAAGRDLVAVPAAADFARAVFVAPEGLRFAVPVRAAFGRAGGAAGGGAGLRGRDHRVVLAAVEALREAGDLGDGGLPGAGDGADDVLRIQSHVGELPTWQRPYTGNATGSPQAIATASEAVRRSAGVPSGHTSSPQARCVAGWRSNCIS